MSKIETVLGPISPDKLGITLLHEHIFLYNQPILYGDPEELAKDPFWNEPISLENLGDIRCGKLNRDKKFTGSDYIIPHSRFVVLGDGFSDIPMFRFFRKKGARGIMVYKKDCMKSFLKARSNVFDNVDYLLERDYTPIESNPLWHYMNKAIHDVSYKKCKHSEVSIYNYKWSKEMCKTEEQEIVNHLSNLYYF